MALQTDADERNMAFPINELSSPDLYAQIGLSGTNRERPVSAGWAGGSTAIGRP